MGGSLRSTGCVADILTKATPSTSRAAPEDGSDGRDVSGGKLVEQGLHLHRQSEILVYGDDLVVVDVDLDDGLLDDLEVRGVRGDDRLRLLEPLHDVGVLDLGESVQLR